MLSRGTGVSRDYGSNPYGDYDQLGSAFDPVLNGQRLGFTRGCEVGFTE